MDYLLRDSHYTGIKYGQFDREYILANLATYDAGGGQLAFGVRDNATHAVEDFLIARFSWYSQIIKNPGSAKFDIMSSHVAQAFLERDLMYQFHDLLAFIEKRDERFFWWNDLYFMSRCQEIRFQGLIRDPRISELTEMLLYRRAPKTVHHPLFRHRILRDEAPIARTAPGRASRTGAHSATNPEKEKLISQIRALVAEMQEVLDRHGTGKEWLLVDIPEKDVVFTRGLGRLSRGRERDSLLRERDPIKVVSRDHRASLLVESENSLMRHLSGFINFVPSVYANESALKLLRARAIL
jgi:hypothetical protein